MTITLVFLRIGLKRKVGVVSTSVRKELEEYVVLAGEGKEEDEYLVTRLDSYNPPLTVVNNYGEQEKVGKEEQEARWGRVRKELEDARRRGHMCLLVGDQNKHVGADNLGVEGNLARVSRGGQLVRDLLATGDWHLVNGMGREVVEGGPTTREDPASGEKSCLQLFVVSTELKPFVSKLYIDSGRTMWVARPVRQKGGFRLVHSDHYPCLLTLKNMPWVSRKESKEKREKKVQWNLAKEGGWT